ERLRRRPRRRGDGPLVAQPGGRHERPRRPRDRGRLDGVRGRHHQPAVLRGARPARDRDVACGRRLARPGAPRGAARAARGGAVRGGCRGGRDRRVKAPSARWHTRPGATKVRERLRGPDPWRHPRMKTQVSELADNRVRLDIEVPAGDVDHAFEHALSDLSQTVRVPGFRKGKAPRPLVMRQVGRDSVVEEALRDHLSGWYSRAVAVAGIDPIDRPTIDWTDEPLEGAPFAFTAEVEVKPPPEVKSYKGLEGVKPEAEVPEEAVDGEIERLRATVAELTAVERGAQDGDFLVIDFEGTMDGTPFEGGSGSQYAVELGTGRLVAALEQGLVGMKAGEERDIPLTMLEDYAAEHFAGKDVSFHVKMSDVKERVLPDLDDEFAMSVSEFDTLDELRADIAERVRNVI